MVKEVTKTVIKEVTTHDSKKIKPIRIRGSKAPKSIEGKVLENLVELQRINTNLAEKFDRLTEQLSKLLALFEMAARSFAQNPAIKASEKDAEFLAKINTLLDQNKTIAKGLTLMEERIRERVYGAPKPSFETMETMPAMEGISEIAESGESKKEEKKDEENKEEYIPSGSNPNRPLPRF